MNKVGIHAYPVVATVTYLTPAGGATVVFDIVGTEYASAMLHGGAGHGFTVSCPVVGKHLCFDGSMLHAAPSDLQSLHSAQVGTRDAPCLSSRSFYYQ